MSDTDQAEDYDELKTLLTDLTDAPGVSGYESEIRDVIADEVEDYVDHYETDDFGNLITYSGDSHSDKRLMVVAHMDQIGLAVQDIDANGDLPYVELGGHRDKTLYNERVTVHGDEDIPGIIGLKPPHVGGKGDNLAIDVGADSKEDVEELGIEKGDPVTYDRELQRLANNYVTGPGLDNRVGCAVAIEALKEFDEDYELTTVFSTQEELGLKGASNVAEQLDPDVALAIDVSVGDYGEDLEMGDGVDITLVQADGRGLVTPESIRDWLIGTAEENDHQYQTSLSSGGMTDAAKIQMAGSGIPTGSLGVPVQYMHSSTEKVSLEDMDSVKRYVEEIYSSFQDHF